jgi:hypothetical protein
MSAINCANSLKLLGISVFPHVYCKILDTSFGRDHKSWGGRLLCIWAEVAGTCLSGAGITDLPAKT